MKRFQKRLADFTQMTPEVADALFVVANGMAITGGILAVIGTSSIFFVGNIREHYAQIKQNELANQTAQAQLEAANANERASELDKENNNIKLELERERKERLVLEEKISPRRVTADLKQDIAEKVVPDVDTLIYFKVAMNNAEGDRLINEIGNACLEAGWPRERLSGATVAGASFPEGVSVIVNPNEIQGASLRKPARGFVAAFQKAGLSSVPPLLYDPEVPLGQVVVSAGLKPDRGLM